MVKPLLIWISLSGLVVPAIAQPDCFAQVALDRHSVYVQQPFKVTITVLTSTWYTAALAFDNIQVPNAFILAFDRTVPGMFEEGGRQYAGLQFYYIVFPYKEGEFVFPAIHIDAETPAPGTSRSRKIMVTTKAQSFSVKPVPGDVKQDWFVASDVVVSEQWSRPLRDLKVGDVVSRTISIRASGTLPQFIPPLPEESLEFAKVYRQNPELRDERNDYEAGGLLTQRVQYLLEKEGDFVLPDVSVQWWNPNSSKLYSRSAKGGKIKVKTNPNLGMLATIRDSLRADSMEKKGKPEERKWTIWGLDWYWVLLILLGACVLVNPLAKIVRKQWGNYRSRRAAWLAGEGYAFKLFTRSGRSIPSFIRAMYGWWDRLPLAKASLSIRAGLGQHGRLREEIMNLLAQSYGQSEGDERVVPAIKKDIRLVRKRWKRGEPVAGDAGISSNQREWVND